MPSLVAVERYQGGSLPALFGPLEKWIQYFFKEYIEYFLGILPLSPATQSLPERLRVRSVMGRVPSDIGIP